MEWDSSLSIVTRLRAAHQRNSGSISCRGKRFTSFYQASRPVLVLIQPFIQWVPPFPAVKWPQHEGGESTNLKPRLIKSAAMPLSPTYFMACIQETLNLSCECSYMTGVVLLLYWTNTNEKENDKIWHFCWRKRIHLGNFSKFCDMGRIPRHVTNTDNCLPHGYHTIICIW